MDFLSALMLGYTAGVAVILSVALTLKFTGRRGKFPRALLISALAGIIVPLATYFAYPYLVSPPVAPPPVPIDQNAPLLSQIFTNFARSLPALGQAVGYDIGRIIDSFGNGVLAAAATFALSFLIPCSGRMKATPQVFQTS